MLVVAPEKYKSVKELVDAGDAKPGALNYATAGAGSASHLNAERFRSPASSKAQHVPFKGAPEALREIIADRIDFYFAPLAPARGLINDGKLAAIAVSSSQRSIGAAECADNGGSRLPELRNTISGSACSHRPRHRRRWSGTAAQGNRGGAWPIRGSPENCRQVGRRSDENERE